MTKNIDPYSNYDYLISSLFNQVDATKKATVNLSPGLTQANTLSNCENPEKASQLSSIPHLEKPRTSKIDYEAILKEFSDPKKNNKFPEYMTTNTDFEKRGTKEAQSVEQSIQDSFKLDKFNFELEKTFETVSKSELDTTSDEHPKNFDALLTKLMVTYFMIQKELEEKFSIFLFKEVKLNESLQEKIKDEKLNLKKDIHDRQKNSEILGWVNVGLACSIIGASLAIYLTAPMALLGAASSGLGILQGVTILSKAFIDRKNDIKTGELFSIGKDQNQLNALIENGIQAMSESMTQISWIVKTLIEIINKRHEAMLLKS